MPQCIEAIKHHQNPPPRSCQCVRALRPQVAQEAADGGSAEQLPPISAAVIMPGFLSDSKDFDALARPEFSMGYVPTILLVQDSKLVDKFAGNNFRKILQFLG